MHYLIVGNGIAGRTAGRSIRQLDPQGKVTILSDEDEAAYSRVLITSYLKGRLEEKELQQDCKEENDFSGVDVLLGARAVNISHEEKKVNLAGGESISYDCLLLATGARPMLPQWPGSHLQGVYTLRTLADARQIAGDCRGGTSALVIGGGFVGLHTACALKEMGLEVRLVEEGPRLLPRVMDEEAASMIKEHLEAKGIKVHTDSEIESLQGRGDRVSGAVLKKREIISCQVVVACLGVVPHDRLALEAAIEADGGIMVNEYMETSREGIYAAGDVAYSMDFLTGTHQVNAIWPSAVQQGWVAGKNMAGCREKYAGDTVLNSMELMGLQAFNMGITLPPRDGDFQIFQYRSAKSYKKIVLQDGLLKGAVLLGEKSPAGLLYSLLLKKVKIKAWAERLLEEGFNYGRLYPLLQR